MLKATCYLGPGFVSSWSKRDRVGHPGQIVRATALDAEAGRIEPTGTDTAGCCKLDTTHRSQNYTRLTAQVWERTEKKENKLSLSHSSRGA